MKKNDKHEPYCGCQNCKRARREWEQHWQHRAEIMEAWLKKQEKQGLPKEPDAVPPDGGG